MKNVELQEFSVQEMKDVNGGNMAGPQGSLSDYVHNRDGFGNSALIGFFKGVLSSMFA